MLLVVVVCVVATGPSRPADGTGTVVVRTHTVQGQTIRPGERRHKNTNTNELLVVCLFLFVFDDENKTFYSNTRSKFDLYDDMDREKRTSEKELMKVPKSWWKG